VGDLWLKGNFARKPFNQMSANLAMFAAVISSQKPRRFATRSAGGLPAMMAELMAPMQIPAIESGCRSA